MNVPSTDERLAAVETEIRALRVDIEHRTGEILARIDGPPWEGSLRAKGHELKGRVDALEAAGLVLAEAQRERRKALDERDRAVRRRHGDWWKLLAAFTAAIAVLAPYVEKIIG